MRQAIFILVCFMQTQGFSQNDTLINGSKNLLIKNNTIDTAMLMKYLSGYWLNESNGFKNIYHYEISFDPNKEFVATIESITEISPDTLIYKDNKSYLHFKIIHNKLVAWITQEKSFDEKQWRKNTATHFDFLSHNELITSDKISAFKKQKTKCIRQTKGNFIK